MADFEFYVNQYKGEAVPEAAFPALAARARDILERMKRIYRVEEAAAQGEDLAVCAMAEALYDAQDQARGISAATVGSVSVRYADAQDARRACRGAVYNAAQRYLNIYRGVAEW